MALLIALGLPLLSCAAVATATAAGPGSAIMAGRPHQAWKLSGNPVDDRFDCGNGTCLLYVGKSGFMDSAAPLVAHRTSDGGVQWSSPKIRGLHNANENRPSRPNVVTTGTSFCVECTDCGAFDDGPCVSRVTCIDQKSGAEAPSPAPTPESVGGAGVEMHELPRSAGGLLLVYPNNAEPGVQQQQWTEADGGMAWIARFEPGSTTPDYNLTFPSIALKTYSVLAHDATIFAVTSTTTWGPPCAVMLDADSGATVWNNTLTDEQAQFMALEAWSVVGSELLIQVLQNNATAYDLKSGEEMWTTSALKDFATDSLTVVGDTVLALNDGDDGNSNTLVAVSTKDGSLAWQYPTVAQLAGMNAVEAFLWDYQCSLHSARDTSAEVLKVSGVGSESNSNSVCWIGFNCQHKGNGGRDADCPATLMPPGYPACGKGESPCNLALNARTGAILYSQSIVSGLPQSMGDGKPDLFRLGDIVMLNGKSGTLSGMSVSNGSMLWTIPCSGCADSLLAFESVAPKGACDAELVALCAAARNDGVAQCGMCAGQNAALLHAAGCSNEKITSWCNTSPSSRSSGVSSSRYDRVYTASGNETLIVAGSDSSISSLPAIVVFEPTTGDVQWTVTVNISGLPGMVNTASLRANSHWSITPLWIESMASNANGGGQSIYLSGVHTEEWVEEGLARRRAQIPPPPPVTFYDYYTWRVDSN